MKVKTLILKILLFIVLLLILDFAIGKTLNYYYFKQKQGEYALLTRTIENPTNQRAEILIMGSSRAKRHYHPGIISATLGKSCYNTGYDAQSILFCKALLDIIREKYKPEIIVLDVNMHALNNEEISYDQLSVLLPYASRYPMLWNTLSLKSPFERIKCISLIYPYNSLLDKIVKGNIVHWEDDINGFVPFYGVYRNDLEERTFPEINLDSNKINAFESFLSICRENNIQLYIVYSPEYVKSLNISPSMNYIIEKCQKQNIEYISYRNNEFFLNNELFQEYLHLNNVGAEKFSLDIALKIKEKINEK
jgi:hypothetical protein